MGGEVIVTLPGDLGVNVSGEAGQNIDLTAPTALAPHSIGNHTDVNLTGAVANNYVKYDGTNWIPGTPDWLTQAAADLLYYPKNSNPSGYLTQATGNNLYPQLSGSYNDPAWINQLAYSKITGVPTFETPITVSNGLTRTAQNITNDLHTGKAGGQNVFGGNATGESLVLKGSNHATPGNVKIDGNLNIGSTGTPPSNYLLNVFGTGSGGSSIALINTNTSSVKTFEIWSNSSGTQSSYTQLLPVNTGVTFDGITMANWVRYGISPGLVGQFIFVLTGQELRLGADGKTRLRLLNDDMYLGHAGGSQKMGFFGVTPILRPTIPTGSSLDTVITALQNLGLFKQS